MWLFEEVGAEAEGAFEGLVVAPLGYACFVAREEDFGYAPAVVVSGTGVDGWCEEVVLEGVAQGALFVAYGAGYEAYDGVGYDDGREFTAGEYVVAD